MLSRVLVASVLLSGALLVCADQETSFSAVPMFLWGKQSYFRGGHNTVADVVHTSDVRSLFTHLISHANTNSKLASYVNTAPVAPEVIVAFIYPKLSSTHASRLTSAYASNAKPSFLQTAISSSTSSLTVPYVSSRTFLHDTLVSAVSTASPKSQIIASKLESKQDSGVTGCNALLNHLQEDSAIFSNRLTDLIILSYDDTLDHENCMSRVISHVDSHTNGHFVTVLTAEPTVTPVQMVFLDGTEPASYWNAPLATTEFALGSSGAIKPRIQAINTSYYSGRPGVTRVTPDTMFALFLAFFMVFVIYTGATCVMSVETPVRFSSTPLQLAKEY